jgi:Rieske Fe-S protein
VNREHRATVEPDMSDASLSRRTALAAGLGGAGILALAACGSSGSSSSDDPGTSAPAADPTGSGGAGTPTGSASKAAAAGLAKLDSIAVGEAVSAQLDGKPVIVARPSSATAACFSAICTHMGCTVAPAGKQLHCPCHGSVYNASTGAVISGPAPRALDKIPVSVAAGEVVPAG